MNDARFLVERHETIVTLTVNRPDMLNAIDGALLEALVRVLG
jgi:enoyl-CoA hydratase/carnithine racemase